MRPGGFGGKVLTSECKRQGEFLNRGMDIDDILAEIDQDVLPQEVRNLHALTRAWVTERSAPEILPWPASLMDRVMERIRQQVCSPYPRLRNDADAKTAVSKIELVEEQTGNIDPKTNFRLIIIQTELERFKFLVRSFLRARIAKVILTSSLAAILMTNAHRLMHTRCTTSTNHPRPQDFPLPRFSMPTPINPFCRLTTVLHS